MAFEQWNGVDVVSLPTSPGLREVQWIYGDTTADSVSPYTRVEQIQYQPGGDLWKAALTLPRMRSDSRAARQWSGFLAALMGRRNVFRLGDPTRRKPLGHATLAPGTTQVSVDGAHVARSMILNVRGFSALPAQLLPGDHLQVGDGLYEVRAQLDGNGAVLIWPSLRSPIADGTAVILREPKGMFRLQANDRDRTVDYTRLMSVGVLKVVEARS